MTDAPTSVPAPVPADAVVTRNVRMTLSYDGARYCGWQVQENGPTLQAALERAITRLTGERVAVYSAGRTDSGVHALGQVVNFHTASPIPPGKFGAALQAHLPPDIVIRDSAEASAGFHATFSARWKRYRYLIDNNLVSLPFLQGRTWWIRRRLDVTAMHAAAQTLVGTHDFRSFETDWPNKATSVRTVHELQVFRQPLWGVWRGGSAAGPEEPRDDSLICLEIVADGFLYNMVRSITGTLVNVGRGKWTAREVLEIKDSQCRSNAGSTAPACGLYLVHVEYDRPWEPAAR